MDAEFTALMLRLMASDNVVREQAERMYDEAVRTQAAMVVEQLMLLLNSDAPAHAREFGAVLLRQQFRGYHGEQSVFSSLPRDTQERVKAHVAQAALQADTASLRAKICHIVGQLAADVFKTAGSDAWPELLPTVLEMARHAELRVQCVGLAIFHRITEYCGDLLVPHFMPLAQLYAGALCAEDLEVRVIALQAACTLLVALKDAKQAMQLQQLVAPVLQVLEATLNTGREDAARDALEALTDVADFRSEVLRPDLPRIGGAMVSIAAAPALDESTRTLAVELLTSLAQGESVAFRKQTRLVQAAAQLALRLLQEVEEDADWADSLKPEPLAGDEEGDMASAGAALVDRLSKYLGGKALLPAILPDIQRMASGSTWQHRWAALIALCLLGEGSIKRLRAHLPAAAALVLAGLRDAEPRVVHAALHCLGQMCVDFGPRQKGTANFQDQFHEPVLQALLQALTLPVLRLRALAAAATCNFVHAEQCRPEYVLPAAEALLQRLVALAQCDAGTVAAVRGWYVQAEHAVSAISALAALLADGHFGPYYDLCMGVAKQALACSGAPEHSLLRGRAMECASMVGAAVGKERFAKDGLELLELLLAAQESGALAVDDAQSLFMAQTCARIAKCVGEAFLPYMGRVLPPLLAAANIDLSDAVVLVDNDEEAEEEEGEGGAAGMGTVHIKVQGAEGGKLVVNTASIQAKANATHMLFQYVSDMQEDFHPFVAPVARCVAPLVAFRLSEHVRTGAICCIPRLMVPLAAAIRHALAAGGAVRGETVDSLRMLVLELLHPLCEALDNDMEDGNMEMLCLLGEAFSETLRLVREEGVDAQTGRRLLAVPVEALPKIFEVVCGGIKRSVSRLLEQRTEATEEAEGDTAAGVDEETMEEWEAAEEQEKDLLSCLVDAVAQLLRMHGPAAIPAFAEELAGELPHWLAMEQLWLAQNAALCLLDDAIENGDAAAEQFVPVLVPQLFKHLLSDNAELRMATAFGVGVCAQHGGAAFAPHVSDALRALQHLVSQPGWRSDPFEAAGDNAVSSLLRLAAYRGGPGLDAGGLFRHLLPLLPLRDDEIEAEACHGLLVRLLESGAPWVLGDGLANLPQLLRVMAELLEGDETISILPDALRNRLIGWLHATKAGRTAVPVQACLQAVGTLPPAAARTLQQALTQAV